MQSSISPLDGAPRMEDTSYPPAPQCNRRDRQASRLFQCRKMELPKTSVRHRRSPEETAMAGAEVREGAGRAEHGRHMWPRRQKGKGVEAERTQHVHLECRKFQSWNPGFLNSHDADA